MQHPDILTGPITTTTLREMIPQTFRKDSSTARASTTTTVADPFFAGIALGVGVWEVNCVFYTFMTTTAANAAVAGWKVNWAFTGTATGNRACLGMANVAANTSTADCSMRSIGSALGTDQTYGVISTFYQPVREDATVVVTVPGTLSINWAQVTSVSNAVNLGVNSLMKIRQIE